ncbi:lactosylceramide 1,3-N-acetyl-beta-D-glucosaminyltransferase-like [Brevipalpus obovatus]|uniref:lactosylceramide 1,3-N-acetyl-beta-D-glucosaminyltransferase-like n=1 Tax=Brevipalpus obovatus TaxID=246614 RepID=UPI003D9F2BB1
MLISVRRWWRNDLSLKRRKFYLYSLFFVIVFLFVTNFDWFSVAFNETIIYDRENSWCPRCGPDAFVPAHLVKDLQLYINKPDACAIDHQAIALVLVTSAPHNVDRRNWIRKTWIRPLKTLNFVVLFSIGYSETESMLVYRENEQYKDIIQWTFHDSWRNLTLKSIANILWFEEHCSNAEFLIKVDDDAVINARALHNSLQPLIGTRSLSGKLLTHNSPCFQWWKQRHCMPKEDHSKLNFIEFYPPYPAGPMYVISKEAALLLSEIMRKTENLHVYFLEDVFITILAKDLNVSIIDQPRFRFCQYLYSRDFEEKVMSAIVAYDCTLKQMNTIWKMIK